MEPLELTIDNFEDIVLKADKPVIVDFWATWCGPCRMQSPVIDEIAAERDDIIVGKVDSDSQAPIAMQFKVMSIPTIIVFKDGKEYKRTVGVTQKEELLGMLD